MSPLFSIIFDQLSKSQKELLLYAAQEVICQHVIYSPGKYIGIDAQYNPKLSPEHTEGLWSIGSIKNAL